MEKVKAASSLMMPKKFRSVREKNGPHRRNKSSEAGGKTRPLTADSFLSIFRPDSVKQAQREKEEMEKEATKVEEISKRLEELNYHDISTDFIRYAINSKFAGGDCDKAVELIQLQQQAFAGIIQPYNANVEMLGAENRGNVTCYLDALLFAMFAKLTAFECMLKNDSADEAQRRLAALLRLWVNLLRRGKLIHTDMTQHIQESLAACGWKEAELLEQQDTSEAFAFITETLQLPLLALQVDLFHHGKRDADDHKVVHERLLNLAVPPDPDGKGIKLEDCLEEYFNNRVDILRDCQDDKRSFDRPLLTPRSTIRVVPEEGHDITAENHENEQLPHRSASQDVLVQSPVSETTPNSPSPDTPSGSRTRSTSIIQRIVVDDVTPPTDSDSKSLLQRVKRTGSTVVKAVTIPAWQFFRLIPWHAASNGEPNSDVEVVRHFNQRPIVGICLKRYTMTAEGVPKRQNTLIDIPDSMRLPHFMIVDDFTEAQAANGLGLQYKLVLQSVVCHRGESLHSGHYIAFARVAPKLLTENRRHDHDPPPDYEDPQWVKFDDLATDKRVTYVDDIKQSLKEEMPYLLFYQIVPMVDMTAGSSDGSVVEPPSYLESATWIPGTPSVGAATDLADAISRSTSGYFDSATTLAHTGPSIRLSSEAERPTRISLDDELYALTIKSYYSRRGSAPVSEPAGHAVATNIAPTVSPQEPASPGAISPAVIPQEESSGTRLSRAAARFAKSGNNKSRPTSQVGEGRMSLSMSRFGFTRSSRDSSAGAANGAPTATNTNSEGSADEADDRDGHGLHHHHHHATRKGRHKDKSRDKDRDKDKGKEEKEKEKETEKKGKGKAAKEAVPDRECVIM